MARRQAPGTEEGWYALHDLRRIDWDEWREAPQRRRERALEEGVEYLQTHERVDDADAGGSAVFSVLGHEADLMTLHLRPTLEHLDRAERRFESTALAEFTERTASYVSVTEVSGYMHEDLADGIEDVEDDGMRNYMRQRIYPEIPDAAHVCFYPMDKRRGPEHNWYDLSFEERKEHMSAHGDIGREYAGRVTQIITGSVGLDDHEWGVTLFADDPTEIKQLLYEMRFDPSTSKFAEFGSFYTGRRFPPADLGALFAGEAVPTDEELAGDTLETAGTASPGDGHAAGAADGGDPTAANGSGGRQERGDSRDGTTAEGGSTPDDGADSGNGGRPSTEPEHQELEASSFTRKAGTYGVDVAESDAGYGLVFESDAETEAVAAEVDGLRENFEHYDTHVKTVVRSDDTETAVVSLWANERAATTASGFLSELPGVRAGVGAELDGDGEATDPSESDDTGGSEGGGRPSPGEASHEAVDAGEFQRRVHRFGVRLEEHPEAGYALLFRSDTDAEDLVEEVDGLRSNFEHYDTHVLTTVRADSGDTAVVSLWANERAATTASGFLGDLPGTGPGVGAELDDGDDEDGAVEDTDEADGEQQTESHGTDEDGDIRAELEEQGVYAGQPHGEEVYALVLYSEADAGTLQAELDGMRERFEHYDTHVKSAVYAEESGDGRSAVVSIWETGDAAETASGFLAELPGVVERAGEESGFGTMGMFYTVEPDHRGEFVETFGEVGEVLAEMEGHLDTQLMVNEDDENDMFIASQWRNREDAMAFFRSDSFRDTVQWGREILADRPRHVFLA